MNYKHGIQYVNFYTDGSAAKKIAPIHHTAKVTLPKPKKRKCKVIFIDPVAILGTVVAICMFVMMLTGISQLRQAQTEAQLMEDYVTRLQQENVQLEEVYEASYDLQEVERTALALGMVSREEVPHNVIYIPQEEAPQETDKTTVLSASSSILED